jgi:hypothetical protein
MTKLRLKIAHQVPGRVRLKIPSAKGNTELLRQISETFGVIPGIEQIAINPTTGSVVLHYDVDRHEEFRGQFRAMPHLHQPPPTELERLAERIEKEAEFLARNSKSARAVVDFFKQFDSQVKQATDNYVDLKILLAVGVIGFTLIEVGTAAATPVWLTFAIFALHHCIEMHAAHEEQSPASAPVIVKG